MCTVHRRPTEYLEAGHGWGREAETRSNQQVITKAESKSKILAWGDSGKGRGGAK